MALACDEGHDGLITAGYRSSHICGYAMAVSQDYRDTSETDIGVGVISRLHSLTRGVQSAHGLLETNFGRTLRFRNHLSLLSHLDSYEGHISRSGTRNNWFDRSGRRRDLCSAFTCLLGPDDNRVWRGILPVSGGLKDQLGGRETPNNFCRTRQRQSCRDTLPRAGDVAQLRIIHSQVVVRNGIPGIVRCPQFVRLGFLLHFSGDAKVVRDNT